MTREITGPKREIVEVIRRTDGDGRIRWAHFLDCGHVSRRVRKSRAKAALCTACRDETPVDLATEMTLEATKAAALALRLGVGVENVRVDGATAMVFFDKDALRRFLA